MSGDELNCDHPQPQLKIWTGDLKTERTARRSCHTLEIEIYFHWHHKRYPNLTRLKKTKDETDNDFGCP